MRFELNELGQPVGLRLDDWTPPQALSTEPMQGLYCRLERLDPQRHGPSLFSANRLDASGRNWTYMAYGPFDTVEDYLLWIRRDCLGTDPLYFAIIDAACGEATGVASFMDIRPTAGSIEVGHVNFSPRLQKTRAATEAMFLMMQRAFDVGYRRYQWKCHALNAASRAAAERLGLQFEGIFRNAVVSKGRNRDTAWYSVIHEDWPGLREAFLAWLAPSNFDDSGCQRVSLSTLTRGCLAIKNGK